MTLYLIPDAAQPVTLADLRRMYPSISWANADAGGPDPDALAHVGGSVAPDPPPYDPLAEALSWDGTDWTVAPILIFDESIHGSVGGSTLGGYV